MQSSNTFTQGSISFKNRERILEYLTVLQYRKGQFYSDCGFNQYMRAIEVIFYCH